MNLNTKYVFFAIALLFGVFFFSGFIFIGSGRLPGSSVEAVDMSLILLIILVVAVLYIYVVWKQKWDENDDDFLYQNQKFKK